MRPHRFYGFVSLDVCFFVGLWLPGGFQESGGFTNPDPGRAAIEQ